MLFNLDIGSIIKIGGYALIALAITGLGYKLYDTIKKNGQYEIIISNQKADLASKDKTISDLQDIIKLNDEILKERDAEIQSLEEANKNLDQDLGTDESDLAAPALREYFKRIEKK